MTSTRINVLILVLIAFLLLTAVQASVEVHRANQAIDTSNAALAESTATLARTQATLNVSERLIAIDAQAATIRIRLEHAPMGLILCLTYNGRERCRLAPEWREWVTAHADQVTDAHAR